MMPLTERALNTKGSPAILLLEMFRCVSLAPITVIKSDKQVLDTALREVDDMD